MIYVPTDDMLVQHIGIMIGQIRRPYHITTKMGTRQHAAYTAQLQILEEVLIVVKAHKEQATKPKASIK
jgi:hypothetical protein